MKRRDFLVSGVAVAAVGAGGCSLLPRSSNCPPIGPGAMASRGITEIDAHCHVFNASDLQVGGFIRKIVVHDGTLPRELADLVADFLEWLAQFAPDATQELNALGALPKGHVLDQLEILRERSDRKTLEETTRLLNANPSLRRRTDAYFRRARNPNDVRLDSRSDAARALASGSLTPQLMLSILSTPGLSELWEFLKPMLRYRASNCSALFGAYSCGEGGIDAFFPAMVDYDHWLGTRSTRTPLIDQAMVMRRVAQLLGMRIRPYVPFNPWSDIVDPGYFGRMTRLMGDKEFIGFKVYPPMGFAPAGNIDIKEAEKPPIWNASGIGDFPRKLDQSMGRFLTWCAQNDVPVMAHGNPSNGPDQHSARLGNPESWARALRHISGTPLRLSIGHFGGHYPDTPAWPDWSPAWAKQMETFPTLFADLSYWEGVLAGNPSAPVRKLESLLLTHPILRERLMYGTDWSMLAMQPRWDGYRNAFKKTLGPVFGPALPKVMGANAKVFAGSRL